MTTPIKKTQLLLIEDNPGDARLIQTYLQDAAFEMYDVIVAVNLQDAVLELMDDEPDVVLLDLGLPDSQGLDTLQEFLQHCQRAPVIVLTGNEEIGLGRESIKHGAQDYLNKGDLSPGHLIRTIHFALERKAGEARLRELLRHDPLTELPNRRLFKEGLASRLVRMAQAKVQVGIINIDIDGFGQINKRFGYAAGDRYIKRIALALDQVKGGSDLLARISSDEFVIVTETPVNAHADHFTQIAQNIHAAVAKVRAGTSESNSITLTASVGIAVSANAEMLAETLMHHAETARQKAKQEGNGSYRYFDEGLEAESKRRAAITKAIQHALEREEYHLVWQPILDMGQNRLLGLEVLLRWEPGQSGKAIPPADFFPVLEESRLAIPVGYWILNKAFEQWGLWLDTGLIDHQTKLFINLSAKQLEDPKFASSVDQALQQFSLPAGALVLEVTETILLGKGTDAVATLEKLVQTGVQFALDDFGSGLSPLTLLFDRKLSYMKIDQSFVKTLLDKKHQENIVGAILDAGKKLGIKVIGEGVESSQISEKLSSLGCQLQQGYIHARPMRAESLEKWAGAANGDSAA